MQEQAPKDPHALVDLGYASAVMASRSLASQRVDSLADRLVTPNHTLGFLLSFLGLRVGPLQPIPYWLELTADICERTHPAVADDMREAAALELHHQAALREDLDELYVHVGSFAARRMLLLPDDPRITYHSKVRALVPVRQDPLVVLAIDLELAVLGLELGPALLERCARHLDPEGLDARRFLQVRARNLAPRIRAREARLGALLREHPQRAHSWARVANDVTQTYLGALEACADHGRTL